MGAEADPGRLPVVGAQQPHFPPGGRGEGGGAVVAVPDAESPPVAVGRAQRRATVDDVGGLGRGDATTLPDVGLSGEEARGGAGDEDLIGGLALAALMGGEGPTEAWVEDVDTEGIGQVLAAEALWTKVRAWHRRLRD